MKAYGILWDLDGVLADSTRLHYLSWAQILKRNGIPFNKELFQRVYGLNNRSTLEVFLGRQPADEELARIGDEKEAWFRQNLAGNVRLLPGVLTWLERFRGWLFRQAVASSAPSENIEAMVDQLGIRAFFDALVSGAGLPGKPQPGVFLQAAQSLGLEASSCLVIEDSPAGVEAAQRAGMRCVAVLTTHPAAELSGTSRIVKRLTRLREMDVRQLLDMDPQPHPVFCGLVEQSRPIYHK